MRNKVICRYPHRLTAWGALLLGTVMAAGGCQPTSSGSGLAAPATQDELAEPATAAMSPEGQGPSSGEPASSEQGTTATSERKWCQGQITLLTRQRNVPDTFLLRT